MGPGDLLKVLKSMPRSEDPDLLVGSENSDDAGVYRVRSNLAVINTVDFFAPIVDDPFLFGQIAAANALSDVYAMGGKVITAMNILACPLEDLGTKVVAQVLRGGAEKVLEAGAVVVGGHTIVDPELKYGMAVTGTVHPDRVVRNGGAVEGDLLVLTKPLGTGIVSTGLKRRVVSDAEENAAVRTMVQLNEVAGLFLRRFRAHACTDVTGFGLAGHASEMAAASSGVRLEFDSECLGLLPGTARLAEAGYVTAGSRRNREYLGSRLSIGRGVEEGVRQAVVDPQTSGGLLVSLSPGDAEAYVETLHGRGLRPAIVGRVVRRADRARIQVSIR